MEGKPRYQVPDQPITGIEPKKCFYQPEQLGGLPIGQFHCPGCGKMVLAGLPHD